MHKREDGLWELDSGQLVSMWWDNGGDHGEEQAEGLEAGIEHANLLFKASYGIELTELKCEVLDPELFKGKREVDGITFNWLIGQDEWVAVIYRNRWPGPTHEEILEMLRAEIAAREEENNADHN